MNLQWICTREAFWIWNWCIIIKSNTIPQSIRHFPMIQWPYGSNQKQVTVCTIVCWMGSVHMTNSIFFYVSIFMNFVVSFLIFLYHRFDVECEYINGALREWETCNKSNNRLNTWNRSKNKKIYAHHHNNIRCINAPLLHLCERDIGFSLFNR